MNCLLSSLSFLTFILTLNVSAVVPSLLHTTKELIVVWAGNLASTPVPSLLGTVYKVVAVAALGFN